jgi:hypothetical protein
VKRQLMLQVPAGTRFLVAAALMILASQLASTAGSRIEQLCCTHLEADSSWQCHSIAEEAAAHLIANGHVIYGPGIWVAHGSPHTPPLAAGKRNGSVCG